MPIRRVRAPQVATQEKRAAHRPSDYRREYNGEAYRLCLLGATDAELAEAFGVSEVTINAWKNAHPEFLKSMQAGKIRADAKVAEKLYNRACGYSHPAVKIFLPTGAEEANEAVVIPFTEHYPPDTAAASLWLRNRQPDKWRDRIDVANTITGQVRFVIEGSPQGPVVDVTPKTKLISEE